MTKTEIKRHVGHEITIAKYEDDIIHNYSLECETCNEVLESHETEYRDKEPHDKTCECLKCIGNTKYGTK